MENVSLGLPAIALRGRTPPNNVCQIQSKTQGLRIPGLKEMNSSGTNSRSRLPKPGAIASKPTAVPREADPYEEYHRKHTDRRRYAVRDTICDRNDKIPYPRQLVRNLFHLDQIGLSGSATQRPAYIVDYWSPQDLNEYLPETERIFSPPTSNIPRYPSRGAQLRRTRKT
ncbi:uncharacterized protein DSM5745_02053 [Aspergillus mulundensis]|uniref:Uncharacterized protein n=1 Tax=Aspergillus mulundensis TaxID=1810919 RepID=A0A3D8SWW6_9EURO|nr:hypothetical protein DSM5745_02053 [Aspergillus mulundensis]RDW90278.1 hypothetical protein DSM5745_02053 [Aspergillus mulundensis]